MLILLLPGSFVTDIPHAHYEEANSNRRYKQKSIRNYLTTQNQPLLFYTLITENEDADAQIKEGNVKSQTCKDKKRRLERDYVEVKEVITRWLREKS